MTEATVEIEKLDKIVEAVNNLSNDAYYVLSLGSMRMWIDGGDFNAKSALMVPPNERSMEAYQELLKNGFVFMDTEREHIGFRSTENGRIASQIIFNTEEDRKRIVK